jgi:multiple sugar transport system permease protein
VKDKFLKIGAYIIHIILVIVVLFPIAFSIVSSFRPMADIFKYVYPIQWQTFIPKHVTLEAYTALFSQFGFGRIFLNTFLVAIANVILGILVNSLAGFAFARFQFKGKNILFLLVMITFMVPFELISIPLFKTVIDIGWGDTYFALIIPTVANGLVIFLYRQFFAGIPDSMFEAAVIDGASWWKIYYRLVMPVSVPVTISAGLLIFINQWESFLWPLLVTHSPQLRVIQVAMSSFNTQYGTLWNSLFAASNITVLIPVILVLFLQHFFVQGISSTGGK